MITENVTAYHGTIDATGMTRYRSWEHCYQYFRGVAPTSFLTDREHAALQLAFYLASWGMYRGSSFLLQYDFTIHFRVLEQLAEPRFRPLWEMEFGAGADDASFVAPILEARDAIRDAYQPYGIPTDTLVTKIMLGTLGCLPAADRNFEQGFKANGHSFSSVNKKFVERVLQFCHQNSGELKSLQRRIEQENGVYYPLMKLVDMHFWQIGYELNLQSK